MFGAWKLASRPANVGTSHLYRHATMNAEASETLWRTVLLSSSVPHSVSPSWSHLPFPFLVDRLCLGRRRRRRRILMTYIPYGMSEGRRDGRSRRGRRRARGLRLSVAEYEEGSIRKNS